MGSVAAMRIAIFGGHGKVALLLTPLLVHAGHDVRSVIRNPDQTADVEARGATAVVSSVEDADTAALTELLTGCDAVIWSAGAGGGSAERTNAVDRDGAIRSMDAARAAGAQRYVMVSFSGADPEHLVDQDDPFRAYQDAKITADDHLRATDLDWTILGPGALTEDPGRSTVNATAAPGDGDTSPRELVAQVAAAVLEDPRAYQRMLVFGEGDTSIDEWLGSLTT